MITPVNNINSSEAKQFSYFKPSDSPIDNSVIRKVIEDEIKEANKKVDIKKNDNSELSKTEDKDFKPNYTVLKDKLKEIMADESMDIRFTKDEGSNKMIMQLVDIETKEIIKQFPPEITLKIARMVASSTEQGLISNAKA